MRRELSILDSTGRPIRREVSHAPRPGTDRLDVVQHRGTYGFTGYGYRSATTATADGRAFLSFSGDAHLDFHRKRLLAQSRDFERNNAIYVGMVERMVAYIVGNGFGLRVKTSDRQANRTLEKLWRQWWRRPEIRGVLSGPQVIRQICREVLVAGDTGVLKTDKATIRLIEAEQIDHAQLTDGISKDDFGSPIYYYVAPYTSSGRVDVRKAMGIQPVNFLFLTNPTRPSQTRGVPQFQSAFPIIHMLFDIMTSEAVSWQQLSRYAVSITREGGPAMGYIESNVDENKSDDEANDTTTRVTELDYALLFHGEPGEKIEGVNRTIPGVNFPESVRMFLRLLGLPAGLPLEIILLDWTKSNYSQSRAVLEQAFETFQTYQDLLEEQFYTPILAWKLSHWSTEIGAEAMDELVSGVRSDDTPSYEWIRPTYPWLNQKEEAEAYAAKLDRSMTTHAHVCKSQKLDREDVLSTRRAEVEEAIEIAAGIEDKFPGAKVPWQIFAGLAAPAAAAATTKENRPEGEGEGEAAEEDKTEDSTTGQPRQEDKSDET
ncbi:phage portal protein [Candidatus Pacearchaeota archaeon]|jgi:capsid protein|nr:phage portal protein [Candidatus Pacearchaeota archaeon]